MPTNGNACARKGRSETWQFAKNKFWSDFVRKQTFRESRQVLLRKRMSRGFEFVLILHTQTTRGSNFGLLATEVYLTSFIILVFSTCVRSIRESLGETTPAGFKHELNVHWVASLPLLAQVKALPEKHRVEVGYQRSSSPLFPTPSEETW
ncbi:hypothetical protein AVEN_255777-1 [Araneus ventricosus]|uniref:Uncharacterized protein n=1 Tax=Araneus ventricosus TaxID=182803 RepID=A0A4Y2P4R5_ARAVE|nr:hypothetical protein AVEN_255777-1 [Araneus ventricosus]